MNSVPDLPYSVDLTAFAEDAEEDFTQEYSRAARTVPLTARRKPVPLAEGLRREPGRRGITLELQYRDLLVCAPWSFSIGILGGRLGLPIAVVALAGAVFGVTFDRFMRRWI